MDRDIKSINTSLATLRIHDSETGAPSSSSILPPPHYFQEQLDKAHNQINQLNAVIANLQAFDSKAFDEKVKFLAMKVGSNVYHLLEPLLPVFKFLNENWKGAKPKLLEFVAQHVAHPQTSPSFNFNLPQKEASVTEGGDGRKKRSLVRTVEKPSVKLTKTTQEKEKGIVITEGEEQKKQKIDVPAGKGKEIQGQSHEEPTQMEVDENEEEESFDPKRILTDEELLKKQAKILSKLEHQKDWFRNMLTRYYETKKLKPEKMMYLIPRFFFNETGTNSWDFPVSPTAHLYKRFTPKEGESVNSKTYKDRLIQFHNDLRSRSSSSVWSVSKLESFIVVGEKVYDDAFRYFEYEIIRNNKKSRISDADFPYMNPYDFVLMIEFVKENKLDEAILRSVFDFMRCYIDELSFFDIVIARSLNRTSPAPNIAVPEEIKLNSRFYQIMLDPSYGVIFRDASAHKDNQKRFFKMTEKEKYTDSFLLNIKLRASTCKYNSKKEIEELKKHLDWYLHFRAEMLKIKTLLYPVIPTQIV